MHAVFLDERLAERPALCDRRVLGEELVEGKPVSTARVEGGDRVED
jgi:hypothetical protein